MAITSALSQRRLIKVFLASPGDLQPERQRAREVVDEINHMLGRYVDIHVDLFGWEETMPGAGRPQELINRYVDDCDLFIGMLWTRWGTPSGEGYTSGFQEEFERAQQRNQNTKTPEIWLAFKQVPQVQLSDPGDQLKKVLAFKQAQIEAQRVLFKQFSDKEEWATQLRDWLMSCIGQLIWQEREAQKKPPQAESSTPEIVVEVQQASMSLRASAVSISTGSVPRAVPLQLSEVAEQFFQAATRDGGSSYPEIMGSLDKFQTTRLFLTAKAWLASRFTYELLSTHEIHLLYLEREQAEFVGPEYDIVLRTLIGDRYASTAGW